MEINSSNILEWSILIFILIGLFYAAIAIKNEKRTFLQNLKTYYIKQFKLQIPSWWGLERDTVSPAKASFVRKDTRYDWKASFEWFSLENPDEELSGKDLFIKIIKNKEIFFDEVGSVIHKIPFPQFDRPSLQTARVEGMATQYGIERIYYDAFIVLDIKAGGYLLCESRSSVLNGMVEGPYFEEVIKSMEIKKT